MDIKEKNQDGLEHLDGPDQGDSKSVSNEEAPVQDGDNQGLKSTSNLRPEEVQDDSRNVDESSTHENNSTLTTSGHLVNNQLGSENLAESEDPSKTDNIEDEDEEHGENSKSFEEVDDGDPIPSGTGVVSRDCSASDLIGWSEILPKWHGKLHQRPKGLTELVRNGIPEPLRGEVWQLLSGAQQYSNLMEQYRIFLTKSAPTEQIILRDVHRTYPAHENFRSGSGSTSLLDSLFKVCKAYSVYDEEVGYCQGLSFLVAALLLHMPEEQAFCVFVCIMQHYGLRNLFRNNFDELYLKFYQLEQLLGEHMPDLYHHFNNIGIEPFTYASQWFLTVFTAKFPLNAVFFIMDIFLLDGMDTIFQVALALLRASKKDLLTLDFEGVLKYFRVQMPKRYRDQENVHQLILASASISVKRLKKYAKSYEAMKQKEKLLENPVTRLQRENAKLTENNLRLEQENDDLARDLVASKIQLRAQLDALEDKTDTLDRALTYSRQDCQSYKNTISDMEDERSRLEVEVSQLKEVCRRELQRAESEQLRDSSIIADYKKICSKLSERLDNRLELTQHFIVSIKDVLRDVESCTEKKCFDEFCSRSDEFMEALKSDEIHTASQGSSPASKNDLKRRQEMRQTSIESDPTNRPIGAYRKAELDSQSTIEHKMNQLTKHVDELEVELARTKLALVESECKCQQLVHDMSVGATVTTTSNSTSNQSISHTSNLLSNKLVSMKAAIVSSNRTFTSPKSTSGGGSSGTGAGSTLAKLNSLISERISSIGQANISQSPSLPNSTSTQLISNSFSSSKMMSDGSLSNVPPPMFLGDGKVSDNGAKATIIDGRNDRNEQC